MLRRMGPLQGVLKLIPGLGNQLEGLDQVDEKQLARIEGIILSMTPRERALPHVIDGSRRQRIARGSGTDVQQVNQLLEARKQMAKVMKQMKSGKMPSLPGLEPPSAANGARAATAQKTKSKRKNKNKKRKARR
jgi:signal recognition particle subunit SRP54